MSGFFAGGVGAFVGSITNDGVFGAAGFTGAGVAGLTGRAVCGRVIGRPGARPESGSTDTRGVMTGGRGASTGVAGAAGFADIFGSTIYPLSVFGRTMTAGVSSNIGGGT